MIHSLRKLILLIFLIFYINLVLSTECAITSDTYDSEHCAMDYNTERDLSDQISELYFLAVLKMAHIKLSIDKKITDLDTKISNELKDIKNILLESKKSKLEKSEFETLSDEQKIGIKMTIFCCIIIFIVGVITIMVAILNILCGNF
jgi:hypothetical protein